MASRSIDADNDVQDEGRISRQPPSWESFCREEAKQWASAFLDGVRRFKIKNALARDVHDSTFTNEFSAAFLEESSILMASGNGIAHSNDHSRHFTTSLPSTQARSTRIDHQESSTPRKTTSKARSWLSHLFKWPKSQRTRGTSAASVSSNTGQVRATNTNTKVLKEGMVQMLNMNADDSSSSSAWQQCNLMLLEDRGNHQLKVYCPPKNSIPKMSLFCFLIKEVRPATRLEIPDSDTCFVIKSENHGEYVFDAGYEDLRQQWMLVIRCHSANIASTNGLVPGYASVNVNSRQRSQSVSAAEIRSSTRSTTLPRALPPPPINGANNVLNLPNSPPVYGRRGSAHSTGGVSRTSELRVGRENTTSQDSVLMDVSAFIRNAPFRSPSRQRKVQSMYVESVLNTRLEGANSRPPHTHSSSLAPQPLQGAGFPYDSPGSSPPPVPKRGVRPKSIAIESSSRTSQDAHKLTTPSPPILTSNANYRVNPTSSNHHHNRRLSQPHLDVAAPIVVPELPSNLDTCSRSSSSSALHPVSLADINRRSGSIPPSPGHTSTQLTTEGRIAMAASGRMRKSSAPVYIPKDNLGRVYIDRDIIHPECTLHNGAAGRSEFPPKANGKFPSDNFLSSPSVRDDSVFSGDEGRSERRPTNNTMPVRPPINDYVALPNNDDVIPVHPPNNDDVIPVHPPNNDDVIPLAPPLGNHHTNEDMTSKATLNFPYSLRSNSPTSSHRVPGQDPYNMPGQEPDNTNQNNSDSPTETRRRLVPYTRLNVSSLACSVSRSPSQDNDAIIERSHSTASNNTDGSAEDVSRDPGLDTAAPTGNPLYVETTESQGYSQSTTHTVHPYENWATTPQDVQNLRLLSQFPWFHGMISRNNASQLVLADGDTGTGQYLVRQSESREGDFVLTFNYHNRAKHLRMTVDEGGCNIQHLWFDDVPSMLEYFKINSIPLESFWLNNDVKLTSFIHRQRSDSFRTTTVVNVNRLNRVPPRRSRSLHLGTSHAVTTSSNPEMPSPVDRPISSSGSSSNSHSTNSLPHSARNSIGWRQLFRSQRSSSAGNMTVHSVSRGGGAGVQRSHSTNAGSLLDAGIRNSGRGSGSGSRGLGRSSQNTYVYRNY